MATIKVKRGTRSEINTAASASGLNQGELYLITDENVLALGTGATTYQDLLSDASISSASAGEILKYDGSNWTNQTDSSPNFRNRIINGNMRIDQRNAGSAVTASGSSEAFFYPVDRNRCYRHASSTAEFTLQQVSDAPPNFDKSYKVTVTTPDSSPSYLLVPFEQAIEGNNIYYLQLGTANAKTFTVSFWVKCSLSGELPVAVFNGPSLTTYYVKNETVAADTWHYKTITIPGATSETFGSTNTAGLYLSIGAAGPAAHQAASAETWLTGGSVKEYLSNSLNIFGTNNATLQITGVQLEEGTVANPFEHRPISVELSLAQRYYQNYIGSDGTQVPGTGVWRNGTRFDCNFILPVVMRSTPEIVNTTNLGNLNVYSGGSANAASAIALNGATPAVCALNVTSSSGTAGNGGYLQPSGASAGFSLQAEL